MTVKISSEVNYERMVNEMKKHNKDLESRAKELHELVVTENFIVNSAIGQDYQTYVSPSSEIIFEGISPSYSAGFTSKLTLEVSPENKNNPIRTIIFNGKCEVKAGDYITAQIPRYREESEKPLLFQDNKDRLFYLDRDFTSEETAIELAVLSEDKTILRTDRSIEYDTFENNNPKLHQNNFDL